MLKAADYDFLKRLMLALRKDYGRQKSYSSEQLDATLARYNLTRSWWRKKSPLTNEELAILAFAHETLRQKLIDNEKESKVKEGEPHVRKARDEIEHDPHLQTTGLFDSGTCDDIGGFDGGGGDGGE